MEASDYMLTTIIRRLLYIDSKLVGTRRLIIEIPEMSPPTSQKKVHKLTKHPTRSPSHCL